MLSLAPASAAARIVGPSAAVCPSAITTPADVARRMNSMRPGSLGSQGDQDDPAARRLLKLLKQAPVGIADRPGGVCTAVTVALRDEGPFEVNADDPGGDVGKRLAGRGDRPNAVQQVIDRRGDQGRDRAGPFPAAPAPGRSRRLDRRSGRDWRTSVPTGR